MIKIIDYGDQLKRQKTYYKATCNHCNAELVFEYGDIWFEEPTQAIGRVECPVCRSKVFMDFFADNPMPPYLFYL
jgi:DNA-directed RNA polymerase subunit RPC12/RpoP